MIQNDAPHPCSTPAGRSTCHVVHAHRAYLGTPPSPDGPRDDPGPFVTYCTSSHTRTVTHRHSGHSPDASTLPPSLDSHRNVVTGEVNGRSVTR
ncbi:hypothetical protein ACWGK1_10390 [Streptomyces wedmorensis]